VLAACESEPAAPSAAIPLEPRPASKARPAPAPPRSPLARFQARLRRREGVVRVLHFGDSHTAPDLLTAAVRRRLQASFGDAGHGYTVLGWKNGYSHVGVRAGASQAWRMFRVWYEPQFRPGDRRFGVGGASIRAGEAGASAWIETRASRFDLHYDASPTGGTLEVRIDSGPLVRVETAGPAGARFRLFETTDAAHRFEVRAVGDGEVALLGVECERPGPGVVWSSLGVGGARASTPLEWDPAIRAAQIARLRPDLVVAMYGSNDVHADGYTAEGFARTIVDLMLAIRAPAPQADCLVLAPPDQAEDARAGRWGSLASIAPAALAASRAAGEAGCAFWDAQAAMGGVGAIARWAALRPPLATRDGVHLTAAGYERLGTSLADAIESDGL